MKKIKKYRKRNSDKSNLKALRYLLVVVIILIFVFISPYLLLLLNDKLNALFGIKIKTGDYLSYVSAVLMGILAVGISIMAYNISKESERRERNLNLYYINKSKRSLECFIKENAQAFYDINNCQGNVQNLHPVGDIEQDIERLHSCDILDDEDERKCREVVRYVSEAIDMRNDGRKTADQFCKAFLNTEYKVFELNAEMKEMIDKLSTKKK